MPRWLIAIVAALSVGAVTAQAATLTWDMANEYNATSIHAEGDTLFAETLSETSNGQIEVVTHFGGALGFKSKDQLDAVADGAIQLADTYVGPLGGIEPIFLLSSLPFLASTIEEAKVLFEVARPYYEKVLAKNRALNAAGSRARV